MNAMLTLTAKASNNRLASLFARLFSLLLILAGLALLQNMPVAKAQNCSGTTTERVMLLGDSWAHFMWVARSHQEVFEKFGFDDIEERGPATVLIGTQAESWNDQNGHTIITNELNNYPSLDIVAISLGGNDIIGDWDVSMTIAQSEAMFVEIQGHLQDLVDVILAVRPDIEIVLYGYDYLNFVETILNFPPALGDNPYIGNWHTMGDPSVYQVNEGLGFLAQVLIDISDADSRVHFVNSLGLMQYVYGYPNPLPIAPGGTFPPGSVPLPGQAPDYIPINGGNMNYPSPPEAMGLNGYDCIHLSDDAFAHFVEHKTVHYFLDKFRSSPDATFTSQGGSHDGLVSSAGFANPGDLRVGASGGQQFKGILSFDTQSLPDNAIVNKASLFIRRKASMGDNPFDGSPFGAPSIDIKNGTFGNTGIEASDFNELADELDVGCFIGDAKEDNYTIRIDLTADAFAHFNTTGTTEFVLHFKSPSSTNGSTDFYNGDHPWLSAPYLDLFYTVPPPEADLLTGNTGVCKGDDLVLEVALNGNFPLTIEWSDGLVQSGLTNATVTRTVSPLANETYSIVSVSDAEGTPGATSGSANLSVDLCPATALIKVFLQGAYLPASGSMRTDLADGEFLPLSQPYNRPPWNYFGTENVQSHSVLPDGAVDWVLAEVREAGNPDAVLETKAAILLNDGSLWDVEAAQAGVVFETLTQQTDYYLVVRHRNHLDVMSAQTVTLPNTMAYDFSPDVANAFGMGQQAQIGAGVYGMYAGDFDGQWYLFSCRLQPFHPANVMDECICPLRCHFGR